jgi:hypothetical protein
MDNDCIGIARSDQPIDFELNTCAIVGSEEDADGIGTSYQAQSACPRVSGIRLARCPVSGGIAETNHAEGSG